MNVSVHLAPGAAAPQPLQGAARLSQGLPAVRVADVQQGEGSGGRWQRPRLLGEQERVMGLLLIIFFQISRQSDHQPALTTRYKIELVSNEMKSAATELCMSKSFLLAVAKYNFDLTSTKHTVIQCLIVSIQQMGIMKGVDIRYL